MAEIYFNSRSNWMGWNKNLREWGLFKCKGTASGSRCP